MCPYICDNKAENGYCAMTACIHPKYRGWHITLNFTPTEEELKDIKQKNDEDVIYGIYKYDTPRNE
jgi:hypothetical protein